MDHQQESRDPAITETETKEATVKNDTNEKTQLVLMVYVEKKTREFNELKIHQWAIRETQTSIFYYNSF